MSHKKNKELPPLPETLNLPFTGADSHAHLISPKLWPQLDEVLERARKAGIVHIGQVFTRVHRYQEYKHYFVDKPFIYFILGIHPADLLKLEPDELDLVREEIVQDRANERRIRAVGEIGLDYYWKEVPSEIQQQYFREQLRMTKELNLPTIIHCRDAFEDTLRILDEEDFADYPLIWHCFGGDTSMVQEIVKRGWHVSISGSVSYKANMATRDALQYIPLDKIMLETDCPYLSPEPWRGHTNEPALVAFTAKTVAESLGMDIADLWTLCGKNMVKFFNQSA